MLSAIDSLMESAHDRLNPAELQLLADIRAGIAENQNEKLVEEHFFSLFNFLMMLKEIFEGKS